MHKLNEGETSEIVKRALFFLLLDCTKGNFGEDPIELK